MRILGLELIAYGPFTGKALRFDEGAANLHILYGPNEAGKSSTLRALSNALFGIPQDTTDGFLHPYDDLRIGLTLETPAGPLRVVRRKGRASSLRRGDGTEPVFPAEEWAALLPVADRDLFERIFGVDHAEIAKGEKLLFSSGSDLGGLLFAAAGGVDRLREVQAALQASAQGLFSKKAKNPPINKAVAELRAGLTAGKQSLLLVSGYTQLRDEVEDAEKRSAELEKQIRDASFEEQRLKRLGQAFPLAVKRQARIDELKQHEDERGVPADFGDRYRGARTDLRQFASEAASQERDMETLLVQIEETPVALEILARESEIELLYPQAAGIRKGEVDRVRWQQSLETARAGAMAALQAIGATEPLAQAGNLRVPDPAKTRIFALSTSKQAVDQRVSAAERDVREAMEAREKASADLAASAEAVETEALAEALAMVTPGRDLEAELSQAKAAATAAAEELDRSVAALPEWPGTLDELVSLRAPLPETIAEFQSRFLVRAAEETRLAGDRNRLRGDREQAERDLQRIQREQAVPTEQDLASSRGLRDAEWQGIRTAWLAGDAENGADRAASFETSILTSDQIADRLRREAARVSEKAALLVVLERLDAQLVTLEGQIEAEQRRAAQIRGEWGACWQASGITPRTPPEMLGWLRQRDAILLQRRDLQQLGETAARLDESVAGIRRAIADPLQAVHGVPVAPGARLPALVAEAKRVVARETERRQRRATLEADVQRLTGTIAGSEARLGAARSDLARWKSEWNEATEKVPVRRDASPEEVQSALAVIATLMERMEEIRTIEDRLGRLDADEERFRLEVMRLAESAGIAPPLENPIAVITRLHAEVQTNRTNRDLLQTFSAQVEGKKKRLGSLQNKAADCERQIQELCREAGVADPEALPACIEKATEQRRLRGELAELEEHLASFAGGETISELVASMEGVNIDALPGRVTELQERVETLRAEKARCDQSLGASRLELKQKEEADTAGQAAENAEHLRARITTLAEDYVRQRLAERILANAVERFRDRNQGPLLQAAAVLFRDLTAGSFEDLCVDWNEQGEAELRGVRAGSRKQVAIAGMSEATRDQLFLALRMAYVVNYCDAHGPVPFVADDILMTFDDLRSTAALRALERLSNHTQVFLFTHHQHHLELAKAGLPATAYRVHTLG